MSELNGFCCDQVRYVFYLKQTGMRRLRVQFMNGFLKFYNGNFKITVTAYAVLSDKINLSTLMSEISFCLL